MKKEGTTAIIFVLTFVLLTGAASSAQDFDWEPNPGRDWVFTSEYGVESLTFRAHNYTDLAKSPLSVSFLLEGFHAGGAEMRRLEGAAISEVWIKPEGDAARITVILRGLADGFSINVSPRSRAFPNSTSVILGFTGIRAPRTDGSGRGVATVVDDEYPEIVVGGPSPGDYDLPMFERRYKYSDALVSIHTRGASVTGILDMLSLIGGISIVLDPYWNEEPTGTGRPPIEGGGAGGGGGWGGDGGFGTGGGPGTGYRGLGTGLISVDLEDVPFDLALDLILTSAGLVYFEIS